jgi:hypothetical protein
LDFTSHILKLHAFCFRNAEKDEDVFYRIKQNKSRNQGIKVLSSRLKTRQILVTKSMQGKKHAYRRANNEFESNMCMGRLGVGLRES